MSAAVLLRRRVPRLGIPRTLKDDIAVIWHLRGWTFGGATGWRQYGGGGGQGDCGFAKFDFMDMTCPHTWYPVARKKRRKVFLHVGPTNSGKTYSALKQLEQGRSGIYCGPLRLLAWEVANRLNKANVPCDLLTGQEREEIEGAKHKSMTVEMADISSDYSCAVIDEIQAGIAQRLNARQGRNINDEAIINGQMSTDTLALICLDSILGSQMLSCKSRGHAFTRALLGIAADELHLCGDPAAVSLIEGILTETGDDLQVQYYKRLSPLVPSKYPLRSYSEIQKGDCIVTFSRQGIYRLKKHVEREGKHLCSVVYGSLPPETRTKQAALFNDTSSNIDVLVASDAIGMGLNLQISRIIFSTMQKFDGVHMRDLTVTEIKQIAGRAGRYGSKYPVGEVTCVDNEDLQMLHSAMNAPSPTLEHAGLFPHYDLILMFSHLHPKAGFRQILEHFLENAKLSSNYFIAESEDMLKIAAILDKLPLSLHDKYVFSMSPVDVDDEISTQGLVQFAQSYVKKSIVHLREIFAVGTLQVPTTPTKLKELESIHKVLDLYVWLSYRMEDSFPDREVALSQKSLCSMLIEEFLLRYGGILQRPKAAKLPLRKGLNKLF